MSFLDALPIVGKLFKDTTDIIKEAVVDKDKQNAIIENLDMIRMEMEKEIYFKELETKTTPKIDALHKMGRQILNYISIIGVYALLFLDKEITPTAAAIITGGNVAYQLIKGKGK